MSRPAPKRLAQSSNLPKARLSGEVALAWERFWPLVLPVFCVLAVFATVSWLSVWPIVQTPVRLFMLALFAVAFFVSLYPLRKFRWPSLSDVDSRIERSSELLHRPVTAQEDNRADVAGGESAFAKALWLEHRRRMAGNLDHLKAGIPVPKVASKDPYALRALVGLFLFVGIAAGWGNWSSRIGDAFREHSVASAASSGRIDAWVTPPAYTNRPPIFINKETAGLTVPEGSELVIRTLGVEQPSVTVATTENEQSVPAVEQKAGGQENSDRSAKLSQTFKTKLEQSGIARLTTNERVLNEWQITLIPDADPTIKFDEDPTASTRGALEFSYSVEDDYGVVIASAEILSTKDAAKSASPLIKAPEISLPLPRRRAKSGTSKTSQDLTSHPWAGAEVKMTLIAEDEAGQQGRSAEKVFALPQRIFTKPLAKAIVEERRNLALDAHAAPQVASMLDIITDTHPDEFIKDKAIYTSLRVAFRMISRSENDDQLREAVELLWETALAVEDGDLSLAEKRLRDAQERLAQALENGATDKEIDELMKELRAAMENFMRELAEQMAKNPQNQQAMPLDENTQVLRQQDLDRLMKQIEDLAKSGSRDAARQLLQDLQRMMNNLQTARPGQQQQQTDEFSQQMNKLGEMMRKQQQLMDQTFDMQRRQQQRDGQKGQQNNGQQQQNQRQQNGQQQGQQGQQQGQQKPMTAEEFAEAMKNLQKQQGELQKQMQEMQDAMRGLGMDPGKKLGEAGEAMGEAEQQLGQGDSGQATGQQGRALQAMREGAQQMMQNMQNQAGEQGRRGERGQHGEQSRGEQDPLGRQSRSQGPQLGNDTKVPGEIDAQRARKILEDIRRRLGESARPKLELDYLDRLLPTR